MDVRFQLICEHIVVDSANPRFRSQKGFKQLKLEIWANAQRDGRPAEYRWRPLFNAAKFG